MSPIPPNERTLEKLNHLVRPFGALLVPKTRLRESEAVKRGRTLLDILFQAGGEDIRLRDALEWCEMSASQLGQDLFALAANDFTTNGFFVEFGATDGVSLSNSLLLEKNFAWQGILGEPARGWHGALQENRRAKIVNECIWSETGREISFSEAHDPELSTISAFVDSDHLRKTRRASLEYAVSTISLNDLLDREQAPFHINFLSVDTEGSEFDILSSFDFSRYSFSAMCVEHNFTGSRDKVRSLLFKNGYVRVLEQFSEWDDWFVPKSHSLAKPDLNQNKV